MKKILSTLLFAACLASVPLAAGAGEPKAAPSKSASASKAKTGAKHRSHKHRAKKAMSSDQSPAAKTKDKSVAK